MSLAETTHIPANVSAIYDLIASQFQVKCQCGELVRVDEVSVARTSPGIATMAAFMAHAADVRSRP